MKINKQQGQQIFILAGPKVIEHFLPHLNAAMEEFKIHRLREVAHFLAQFSHETRGLSKLSEDLFYRTPERLMAVWPSRFKTVEAAKPYVANPEKLANFVYAGRMGNGTPESGDGWRYRGAGGFMVTGKTNQLLCAEKFGILPAKIGDWLRTPEGACRSAAWFFVTSGAAIQAEMGKVDKVSDIINLGRKTEKIGDAIGYAERVYLTNCALNTLERDVA